ncbi:hypothetical protein SLS55_003034 [Diplodia seriata]|uniref:6-phosphogluconate dehydrogenase NADP-binding domain-containing protein n=1 Tax=Diplodia seriata TaxID=420778 RepID=A0ABR3CM21_9PEZI
MERYARLGSMGLAMATNLQKHLQSTSLPPLHYTNRTMSRGASLSDLGAIPHPSAASLADSADVIFLSLAEDAALAATVDALRLAFDLAGKVVVDTSTVHPAASAAAAARLAERGADFVAAPVFGASPVAAEGRLLFVVAGEDAVVEEAVVPYVVGVMGRAVLRVGEDVRMAGVMKTAG